MGRWCRAMPGITAAPTTRTAATEPMAAEAAMATTTQTATARARAALRLRRIRSASSFLDPFLSWGRAARFGLFFSEPMRGAGSQDPASMLFAPHERAYVPGRTRAAPGQPGLR